MVENKKKIEIEVYCGRKITIIAENGWGSAFPNAQEINEKIKLGEIFITIKGLNDQAHTFRLTDIKYVVESKFDEPEPMNGDEVENVE